MSDKKLLKEKLNNCFLDLQRSAVSFYLNPDGETHQIFLQHAQKILREIKDKKSQGFSVRISQLVKETSHLPQNKSERIKVADKILTLGCLVKQ